MGAAYLEELGLGQAQVHTATPELNFRSRGHVQAVRIFLAACAAVSFLSSILLLVMGGGSYAQNYAEYVTAFLAMLNGALCLLVLRYARVERYHILTSILLGCIIALVGDLAYVRGLGLQSISLGFLPLIVISSTALSGMRHGASMCALSALMVGLLSLAEARGLVPLTPYTSYQSIGIKFGAHLLLQVAAFVCGLGVLHMVNRSLADAQERGERFRRLLAMAADWYWEMDADLCFSHVSENIPGISGVEIGSRMGRNPWDIDELGLNDEELDAHRADLEERRSFHGLVARRRQADGGTRFVSVSGEPRFDKHGSFTGYWGVGRDVTKEVQAEQAILATETRYRELFRRSPSPLVLHRFGRVLDANPAAMSMFGYTQRASMVGQDLFTHYEAPDAERARQSVARIESMPLGAAAPMSEYCLRTLARQRRVVRATSVRVDAASGPATLSFFVDQTEQARAQEAMRRSEGLLSHLVATSPDVITLTDKTSGRYAMVNKTFEQLTGYSAAQVIGRTPAHLGIWGMAGELEHLTAQVDAHASAHEVPTTYVNKAGQAILLLSSAAPFTMDGQDYLVINARDVTENERTRLAHQAILDNASIGICYTRDRVILQANAALEQMLGWEPGTLVGQSGRVVWTSDDDYREVGRLYGPSLLRGEQVEFERVMARRDGSYVLSRLLARGLDATQPSLGGTIWIIEDITERRRVESALAAALDDAKAASRAKSAFLANTSHEIRTPLNGLVGLARMAQQPDLNETLRRQYLAQMLDSAEGLAGLISDILDLSKIEAGRLTLEALPFALRDMLLALRLAYVTLAQTRGLSFQLLIDSDVPAWVMADQLRTRQILSNYLTNAIKFTQQGQVSLHVSLKNHSTVRFEVRDTGLGIDAKLQSRLFQPFTQADDSTTRRFGGTGLGLSICRELAELMAGRVGLQSQIGEGSLFWVELPMPSCDEPAHTQNGLLDDSSVRDGGLFERRLLIVEDNPVNMMIGVALLEQWGATVSQAGNGQQAIRAVVEAARANRPFHAVLMDVQMPQMSGHEATRILRRQYSAKRLPIIALTAAALVSERDEAMAAGMNDFLTKPIDAARMRQVLVQHCGNADNASVASRTDPH